MKKMNFDTFAGVCRRGGMQKDKIPCKNRGSRAKFQDQHDAVGLRPITEASIDAVRGMLVRNPGEPRVTQELIQAHADEAAGEC